MKYINKYTKRIISESTYDELDWDDQLDYKPIDDDDDGGSFISSAVIGAVTDSALLGGILGGDMLGGTVGDMLDGDLWD